MCNWPIPLKTISFVSHVVKIRASDLLLSLMQPETVFLDIALDFGSIAKDSTAAEARL